MTGSSISDDGRLVTFQSFDGDLAADDFNDTFDVFIRDLTDGSTELVSRRAAALPAPTSASRAGIGSNPISSDGRFLLFASTAKNLVTNNTQSLENLYVRDLWIGSNQMVTVRVTGGTADNGMNFTPAISGDGRWAVFQSSSTNLTSDDTNIYPDIFVRDLWSGTNYPVSQAGSGGAANQFSVNPAISSNGQFVVFQSLASNITPLDVNSAIDVFVRDRTLQTNIALSVDPLTGKCVGAQASTGPVNVTPYPPLITPDGQWLVMWSTVNLTTNAPPVGSPGLYAKQIHTGQTFALGIPTNGVLLAGNQSAVLSPSGQFVTFTTTNDLVGVFDFATQTNMPALGNGRNPSLSADGRWLAFESPATNWGVIPGNNESDVFVLDRQQSTVRLVSANRTGTASGNDRSTTGLISADGRFVVFESFASDLAPGNYSQTREVFVLRLTTGDSDGDGMNDDWEMTYFGKLSHDGTGDADGDGVTDLAEFRAGTIPNDNASVLRVLTLTSLSAGPATLFWSSVPGKSYRVEYMDDLAGTNWSEIPGDIFATGPTASQTDSNPASGRRFYRVRVLH